MSESQHSDPFHVVVAGGGVAGLECVLALSELAGEAVRITLVAAGTDFELGAMRCAEPFAAGHAERHSLAGLAADTGAELLRDAVIAADAERRVATCASGTELEYDALVLAPGARRVAAYEHALTFGLERAPRAFNGLLADLEQGYTRSVAFVVPPGVSWPLPLYELALMTAEHVRAMGIDDAELTLVTPEDAPLAIFGPAPSHAVRELLRGAGVGVRVASYAEVPASGRLVLMPGHEELRVQRIVALPRLVGRRIAGVPCDEHGFVPVDDFGRVRGLDGVYAAGDVSNFPLKQGGIAAQQADAVAGDIAARAGARVAPTPFRPVLRGKLLTGGAPRYLRDGGAGRVSIQPLWSPPAKVSGRRLARWLEADHEVPAGVPAVDVDVEVVPEPPSPVWRLELDPLGPMRVAI